MTILPASDRFPLRLSLLLVLLSLGGLPGLRPLSANGDETAYQDITAEGGIIDLGKSVPGIIDLPGESSFALLRDGNHQVIVAAGRTASGRAVAFSHGGFLKSEALPTQPAVAALVRRAIGWAGRSESPRVGIQPGLKWLERLLSEAEIPVEVVAPTEVSRDTLDVYCLIAQTGIDDPEIEALLTFAEKGGGLVVAATPWAFANRYREFDRFPANRLVAAAGLRFQSDGYASGKRPIKIGAPSLAGKDGKSSALVAVEHLTRTRGKGEPGELERWIDGMNTGLNLKGRALETFLAGLEGLNRKLGPIVPSRETPLIPGKAPLLDAIVALEDELNQQLPAGKMYPIPAAVDYPGTVPIEAPRVSRELRVDGTWKGWLSGRNAGGWSAKEMRPTGLYAAPGEVIRINAPESVLGKGYEIVIGAYGGSLRNRDKWFRYPRLQVRRLLDRPTTEISNALGGLITIRVPRDAEAGTLSFKIEGAVDAPLYIHGKTKLEEWKQTLRHHPAPWAELASDRMIIAIPASYIRDLDDPEAVMEVWNDIIDTSAVLVQVDRDQYRAERIVFDRQTSAGSMHSSYPVAAHTGKAAEKAVDAALLREEGDWGFFHEYGHNHQHDLWALPGTGETTCNLWSVYVYEELIGKPRDQTHGAIRPLNRKQRMNAYFQGGRDFSTWAMWVALEPYLQIQEAFGWEPYQMVFNEYNRLPKDQWPRTQQEKNDQWVIRLSRACGKNLEPFWTAWNLPLSDSVAEALQELPTWEDHPVRSYLD